MTLQSLVNTQKIKDKIIQLGPWHHDIEVVSGVWTQQVSANAAYGKEFGSPSIINPALYMKDIVKTVYPEGFEGRSLLDCACNAGGYLFSAAELGAGNAFGFDVRQHWIDQARFVAEHRPGNTIEFACLDLKDLPDLGLQPFDMTIFNGIFYHLPDPVAGLRVAADLTSELLLLNTHITNARENCLVINPESTSEVMSGVHGLAWLPSNEKVLTDVLHWCGFPHVRTRYMIETTWYPRIDIIAAREEKTLFHYDKLNALNKSPDKSWFRKVFKK